MAPAIQTLTGQDIAAYLSLLRLDPFWVSWMTNADVQHIEIQHSAGGIFLFANGKLLPHVAWSGESLTNAVTATATLWGQGPMTAIVNAYLPLVQNIGIGVVLMFPQQDGVAEIAVHPVGTVPTTPAAAEPSMIFKTELVYDDNGVPTIKGLDYSMMQMAQAASLPELNSVTLPPALIQQMKALNVQTLGLRAYNNGLWISVNGMEMPHVALGDSVLADTAALYAQLNPGSPLIETINFMLPAIGQADVDLTIRFPIAGQ
jgi:hypothetical protein